MLQPAATKMIFLYLEKVWSQVGTNFSREELIHLRWIMVSCHRQPTLFSFLELNTILQLSSLASMVTIVLQTTT